MAPCQVCEGKLFIKIFSLLFFEKWALYFKLDNIARNHPIAEDCTVCSELQFQQGMIISFFPPALNKHKASGPK